MKDLVDSKQLLDFVNFCWVRAKDEHHTKLICKQVVEGGFFIKFNFAYIPCLTPSDGLVQKSKNHHTLIKYVCCCGTYYTNIKS
jgi:hypothetical protein